ncbi:DUF3352 domain-containing protein [Synechococcus sp. MVIR-18-1]|uniref:DUF3352 domain-containing protein n=1 Tax=Synechococcus sp. MVIR-18-1 TaxID=1386941 RepID=UPI0016461120|nr:DUF3352 domain-containing protein [Synechococcus sp. MVIR-18-1]QNI77751.1 hypothetical protein SynMVIR181_02811 [Synechococcus sp. MVIR-18-1]
MKARSFLLAVAAAVLVLLTTALGLWWAMAQQSPLKIVGQALVLPRAARFVPKDASLSLHWLSDPVRMPAYAQAVAPVSRRRQARDSTQQLRDGAFALAGLDFVGELADWIGPQVSLSLLAPVADAPAGWVLALTSLDQDGAKRFLQRFWQTRSLAGTDLQISRYRGMGVISGRGALLGRDPQPIATALIDDDLLLIASSRGVLEQSLDVSQLDALHQLGDLALEADLKQLGRGAALLTADPAAMATWLGMPSSISDRDDLVGLVAALDPKGTALNLDAVLRFRQPLGSAGNGITLSHSLMRSAGGSASALAVLSDPAALLSPQSDAPVAQWLAPVLKETLQTLGAEGASAVVGLDAGPLLWEQGEEGWLLGTSSDQPGLEAVDADLQAKGLVRSALPSEGSALEVWTRLARQRQRGEASLQAQLAVALERESGQDWWGQTLDALTTRQDHAALEPRLDQLRALQDEGAAPLAQQLALATEPSRAQLQKWRPWSLIQSVAGQPLLPAVQELALAAGPDQEEGAGQAGSNRLRLRAQLRFG